MKFHTAQKRKGAAKKEETRAEMSALPSTAGRHKALEGTARPGTVRLLLSENGKFNLAAKAKVKRKAFQKYENKRSHINSSKKKLRGRMLLGLQSKH